MNKELKEILKITDDFLKIPAVTHHEKPFLDYLEKQIKKLGYKTISTSRYLVIKPKNNLTPKYLFSSHIDRHGLIRNEKNEFEYLAYYYKKKYDLKFHKDYHDFYIQAALRHTHDKIASYNEKTGKIIKKYGTLRYNLDWKNKLVSYDLDKLPQESEKVFCFLSQNTLKDNLFFAQIDNVISAAILFHLLKTTNFSQEIIFTTQEEIGRSWMCVTDYLKTQEQNLDIITLDTTPYENFNEKKEGFLVLRKGDENGAFNLKLVKEIHTFLESQSCPIEYKPSNLGMTELGRISTESKGKYNGATIQIPTLNYHTTYETATLESLKNYLKIIKELGK